MDSMLSGDVLVELKKKVEVTTEPTYEKLRELHKDLKKIDPCLNVNSWRDFHIGMNLLSSFMTECHH